MRKKSDIKIILGLSQDEMALLLDIKPSQWSMFKSDKRDIPEEAKKQLSSLLKRVREQKSASKEVQKVMEDEMQRAREELVVEAAKTQIKIHRLEKQIGVMENLRTESFAALESAAVLAAQEANARTIAMAEKIRLRALNNLKKHSLYKLTELQIKKESLEWLKGKIGQRIEQLEKQLVFSDIK